MDKKKQKTHSLSGKRTIIVILVGLLKTRLKDLGTETWNFRTEFSTPFLERPVE
jgi:hypothetical protein